MKINLWKKSVLKILDQKRECICIWEQLIFFGNPPNEYMLKKWILCCLKDFSPKRGREKENSGTHLPLVPKISRKKSELPGGGINCVRVRVCVRVEMGFQSMFFKPAEICHRILEQRQAPGCMIAHPASGYFHDLWPKWRISSKPWCSYSVAQESIGLWVFIAIAHMHQEPHIGTETHICNILTPPTKKAVYPNAFTSFTMPSNHSCTER